MSEISKERRDELREWIKTGSWFGGSKGEAMLAVLDMADRAEAVKAERDGAMEMARTAVKQLESVREEWKRTDNEQRRLESQATAKERQRAESAEAALRKINDIRNSIIGHQTINWSEHVYPLVAALDEAGVKGMSYPDAKAHCQSLHDQLKAAEAQRDRLAAEANADCFACDGIGDTVWPSEDGGSPRLECPVCKGTGKVSAVRRARDSAIAECEAMADKLVQLFQDKGHFSGSASALVLRDAFAAKRREGT